MKNKRRLGPPIHESIKQRLGYTNSETDHEIYTDWKMRKSRVCKPCWELKYCPYGPFVEQSPILPSERAGMLSHIKYLSDCLEKDVVGQVIPLSPELKIEYSRWLEDDDVLIMQVLRQMQQKEHFEHLETLESKDQKLSEWLGGELPPPHIYRVEYDGGLSEAPDESDFEPEIWSEIEKQVAARKAEISEAINTEIADTRKPLEPIRRTWFQETVDDFDEDDYPEIVPEVFQEGACNVFGHICPVFFAAEIVTESEQERRIGRRHLGFSKMMRIVRRDDYRCQHCKEKLKDDEVEFDHIIPVSKGGSSEEHNLRLTCYDCNRDKRDDYTP